MLPDGDYGDTSESFRRQAQSTIFIHNGDEIIVEGDMEGYAVYRNIESGPYNELHTMTWSELVEECEPMAENWITMP